MEWNEKDRWRMKWTTRRKRNGMDLEEMEWNILTTERNGMDNGLDLK